jgi:hypothetical protein
MGHPIVPPLDRCIRRAFPEDSADALLKRLRELELPLYNGPFERVGFAIVFAARGDLQRFYDLCDLAETDWRDALVAGGLAEENWAETVETVLRGERP